MRNLLDRELQKLHEEILRLGGMVENSVDQTIVALRDMNADLAESIIAKDDEIDRMEGSIEKHCLSLFALQHPMAGDLRIIGSSLKMLTDLERIADHSADIAELTVRLAKSRTTRPQATIFQMAERARGMIRKSLEAYLTGDVEAAKAVCSEDDVVDNMFNDIIMDMVNRMKQDPSCVETSIDLMFIVKYLERMADHATNIGEWVIYNKTGVHDHMQHPQQHEHDEMDDDL